MHPSANTHHSMAAQPDWSPAVAERAATFERAWAAFFQHLESSEKSDSLLPSALGYAALGGGKRLRPLLVIESCSAVGGGVDAALPPAIAVELVHTFSLVHDDLPAMDDDDLRRGRPTTHRAYDEATAILAGDWMLARAFGVLVESGLSATQRSACVAVLSSATCDVISGQAADLAGEAVPADRERTSAIHRRKTAALFDACAAMGAIAGGAGPNEIEQLRNFGRSIGLLFQIADDLLDVDAGVEVLGKPSGKDAARGKQTYPRAFGVAESRAEAARLNRAALESLSGFGVTADGLRAIAARIADRAGVGSPTSR